MDIPDVDESFGNWLLSYSPGSVDSFSYKFRHHMIRNKGVMSKNVKGAPIFGHLLVAFPIVCQEYYC